MHALHSFVRMTCGGLLLILAATIANAQFRASVQGTVKDTGGGLVPDATVTLTSNETNKTQQVTTSSDGFYRISGLAPGRYTLSAEKAGFKKEELKDVVVTAETTQGIDLVLSP